MLESAVFMSFAVLGIGFLAKIKYNIDQIESKLKALERIVNEIRRKQATKNWRQRWLRCSIAVFTLIHIKENDRIGELIFNFKQCIEICGGYIKLRYKHY